MLFEPGSVRCTPDNPECRRRFTRPVVARSSGTQNLRPVSPGVLRDTFPLFPRLLGDQCHWNTGRRRARIPTRWGWKVTIYAERFWPYAATVSGVGKTVSR